MTRLFVAVWPPTDVVEELMALPRKDQAGVRFVPPDRWHVTLRFLGDADADAVEAALDAAVAAEGLPTVAAHLGPAVDVLAERQLVVPVHGVDELAAAVVRATARLGDPPPRRRFVGHLTLARLRRRGGAPVTMPPVLGQPFRADLPVEEVALVRSRLHPDGARYDTLATWPVG